MKTCAFFFMLIFLNTPWVSWAANEKACVEEVCFNAKEPVSEKSLSLKGAGLLEYLFFDLYVAAFYTLDDVNAPTELTEDTPRLLVIEYLRTIKSHQIAKAARDILKKNPNVNYLEMDPKIQKMAESFQDVKKGDRYKLLYEPNRGTSLFFNESYVTTIPGGEFAEIYFGIWISEFAGNRTLQNKLWAGIPKSK